jgi:hypothetical protein
MVIASRSTDGKFNATAPMLFMVKRVAFLLGVFERGVLGKDADKSAAQGEKLFIARHSATYAARR